MYVFAVPPDSEGRLTHALLSVLDRGPRELVADFLAWAGTPLPPGLAAADVEVRSGWRVDGVWTDGCLRIPGRFLVIIEGHGTDPYLSSRLHVLRSAAKRLPFPWRILVLQPDAEKEQPESRIVRRSWMELFVWLRHRQTRHPPGGATYMLIDEFCRLVEFEGLVPFGGFAVEDFSRAAQALPAVAPVLRAYYRFVDAVFDELEHRGHEVEELEPPEDEEYALWEQGLLVVRALLDGGGGDGEEADDVEIELALDLEARRLEVGLYLLPDRHPGFWRWVESTHLEGLEIRPADPAERAEAEEAGVVWSVQLDPDSGLQAMQLVQDAADQCENLMRLGRMFLP